MDAETAVEVVASDVEGTLSTGVTWRGMVEYLHKAGRGRAFKRFRNRNLLTVIRYRFGWLPDSEVQHFKEKWLRGILQLCYGYSRSQFGELATYVVEEVLWPQRRQVVVDELLAHKAQGRRVVLISGVFEPMLEQICARLAVEGIGTPLSFNGEMFIGKPATPFNTGRLKAERLRAFADGNGQIFGAYGDTYADIPMLSMSQNPVAVAPDSGLREKALEAGWRVMEAE